MPIPRFRDPTHLYIPVDFSTKDGCKSPLLLPSILLGRKACAQCCIFFPGERSRESFWHLWPWRSILIQIRERLQHLLSKPDNIRKGVQHCMLKDMKMSIRSWLLIATVTWEIKASCQLVYVTVTVNTVSSQKASKTHSVAILCFLHGHNSSFLAIVQPWSGIWQLHSRWQSYVQSAWVAEISWHSAFSYTSLGLVEGIPRC